MYKYKLKEIEVGTTDINNGIKTKIISKDPETKTTEWEVKYNVDLGSPIKKFNEALESLREISKQHRDDSFLRDIIESVKSIKNDYRAHVRTEYPADYDELKRKSAYMKEDIEGLDEEDGAGGYSTPFAFSAKKNSPNPATKYMVKTFKYKLVPKKIKGSGLEVKQLWKENGI